MSPEPKPKKIVVVEDDPQICALVTRVLSSGGYAVAATTDPTRAVDLVKVESPDLVISDISMPEMDGYAVLRALQTDPATARFPVVFLTAHKEFSERVRAFRFGVVDFLAKPFTREILLRKVERVLDGLARRSGVLEVTESEAPPAEVLDELKRDARTGVLTVTTTEGESKLLVRAGEVVDKKAPEVPKTAEKVAFTELDPHKEHIAEHDREGLPGSTAEPPSFDSLPQMLREVLIVDDYDRFRGFLRDLLKMQGFTVHEAKDGEAALRLALEHRPWLILTDVRMPGMDGFEFCKAVRSHSLIRQTPLLFLSGWDDYKNRYLGMELGADDFLSKDTPVRELLLRIHVILKRYSMLNAPGRRGTTGGMHGQLQMIGAPGLLQVCHLTRLSGELSVKDGTRWVTVRFKDGQVIGAKTAEEEGRPAINALLAWEHGSFDFTPGDPGAGEPLGDSFDELVLEGCRLLDERHKSPGEAGPKP